MCPYKIAQLILSPSQKTESTCEIYLSQPDSAKEALAGKLFALIVMESKKTENLKIINFLLNTLNHNYYQNEKMILRERLSNIKIEHIFESALAKTNKKLAEFLHNEKIKLNPAIINITIGVVYKNSLHFTNLGKNKALLIYKNKDGKNVLNYKIADITEETNSGDNKKQISLTKLFSNVVSGSIPSSGYFFFTSEALPEYIAGKELTDIITNLAPAGAMEQIKNILVKINTFIPFLAILIKNTAGAASLVETKITAGPRPKLASIAGLSQTEERTEKLLTPSGAVSVKKWADYLSKLFGRTGAADNQLIGGNKIFLLKDKIFLKKKANFLSIGKLYRGVKTAVLYAAGLVVNLAKILANREKMAEFRRNGRDGLWQIGKTALFHAAKVIGWYRNSSLKNKILLAVIFISFIFLSQSLLWQNFKNRKSQEQKAINDTIKIIMQKQNQIDASLLYDNEDNARTLLQETSGLIAGLPKATADERERYQRFLKKNTEQLEKINHVTRIESPAELANFANLNLKAAPANIALINGKIYAADASRTTIYSLDLKNKLITAVENLKPAGFSLRVFAADQKNNKIYYLSGNDILEFNVKTEEAASLKLIYPGEAAKINDLKIYNNRLYALDSSLGKIYRLNRTQDGFSGAISWASDKTDLAPAISMDIDGNIYVVTANGQLLKYLKGKKQDFKLTNIEPGLNHADKLLVSADNKYIYILDAGGKRLLVFNKDGNAVIQYTSGTFTGLKDFAVDETAKKIYLLNNASIYTIEADYLKE